MRHQALEEVHTQTNRKMAEGSGDELDRQEFSHCETESGSGRLHCYCGLCYVKVLCFIHQHVAGLCTSPFVWRSILIT